MRSCSKQGNVGNPLGKTIPLEVAILDTIDNLKYKMKDVGNILRGGTHILVNMSDGWKSTQINV